jgi:hypothetical protein
MPIEDFIILVYCCVDKIYHQTLKDVKLRKRGYQPKLSDPEIITMELVGEFLSIDTDKGIWQYFGQHWKGWFPNLGSRSNFAKQTANLWAVKQQIQNCLSLELGAYDDNIHMVDGFPVPLCLFKRANRCCSFEDSAEYGYCATKDETFYGFRGHLIVDFNGTIANMTVTAANLDERDAIWEMCEPLHGLLIGDKGYISQMLKDDLLFEGILIETPLKSNMKDDRSKDYRRKLVSKRRLIETVIGQLTMQFNIEKVWARDLWHLTNRFTRKILSHTMGVFLNRMMGRNPLQFDGLIQ